MGMNISAIIEAPAIYPCFLTQEIGKTLYSVDLAFDQRDPVKSIASSSFKSLAIWQIYMSPRTSRKGSKFELCFRHLVHNIRFNLTVGA
jgi:hypothetical protein